MEKKLDRRNRRLLAENIVRGCGAAMDSGSNDSCLIDLFQLAVRFNISQVRL